MPFNTNSNTTTRDYSGYNNNATIQTCEWIENGVVGGAFHFGGSKDYMFSAGLPDLFNDLYRNSFTISIWVKCSEMDRDNKIIIEVRKDNPNFIRLYQEDNAFNFGVCVNGNKSAVKTESCLSNMWYHIAAVWNQKNNELAIYLNGTKCIMQEASNSFSSGAHVGIDIGHGAAGSGGYWYGYLDEIQIYDHILTDDQISQIYLNQKNGQSNKEVIVSDETSEGEIWQCIITPNNGICDDIPVQSNFLKIIDYEGRD